MLFIEERFFHNIVKIDNNDYDIEFVHLKNEETERYRAFVINLSGDQNHRYYFTQESGAWHAMPQISNLTLLNVLLAIIAEHQDGNFQI